MKKFLFSLFFLCCLTGCVKVELAKARFDYGDIVRHKSSNHRMVVLRGDDRWGYTVQWIDEYGAVRVYCFNNFELEAVDE